MISVIVATFGSSKWEQMGKETYESLGSQTVRPASVHRIHGRSLATARNEGAMQAKGEWLLFLDADDSLHPKFIEFMMTVIRRHRNPDALIRPAILRSEDSCLPYVLPEIDLGTNNFMIIGTLVKKETFLRVGGFDDSLPLLEDWDLWIRCRLDGCIYLSSPKSIYYITVNEGSRNQQNGIAGRVSTKIRRKYQKAWDARQR